MIILDTDVASLVQREKSEVSVRVRARIAQRPREEVTALTIITYYEQCRGWLGFIAKARAKSEHIYAFSLLEAHLRYYRMAHVLPYDAAAADLFDQLRASFPRLGTMDLRIASICISRNALLVSRNLSDFENIPNLRVEDWTKA